MSGEKGIELYLGEEFAKKLEKFGADDTVYRKMAAAGQKPLKKALIKNLEAHRNTGQLIASLKAKVSHNKKDGSYFTRVIPTEYRTNKSKKGDNSQPSNNQVLISLEYGTHIPPKIGKEKQPPRPLIAKSSREAMPEAAPEMQKALEKRAKELGL